MLTVVNRRKINEAVSLHTFSDGSCVIKKDYTIYNMWDDNMPQWARLSLEQEIFCSRLARALDIASPQVQEVTCGVLEMPYIKGTPLNATNYRPYDLSLSQYALICGFDVLIENFDRHPGNIIWDGTTLWAIDHGYSPLEYDRSIESFVYHYQEMISRKFWQLIPLKTWKKVLLNFECSDKIRERLLKQWNELYCLEQTYDA